MKEIGLCNIAFFALATATPDRDAGALSAEQLLQTAELIEEFADSLDLRHLWYPPKAIAEGVPLAEQVRQGPRTSGDHAVRVENDGSVYVADTWNYRIQKFSPDGKFITMWGNSGQGTDPQLLYGPRGIAIDSTGRVLVTDTGNKRVLVYSPDGQYLTQFGSAGMEAGQLDEPVGIALNNDDLVYIADTWNQRVQVFKPDATGMVFFPTTRWEI